MIKIMVRREKCEVTKTRQEQNCIPWKDHEHHNVQSLSKTCHSKQLCPRQTQPSQSVPKPNPHFQQDS